MRLMGWLGILMITSLNRSWGLTLCNLQVPNREYNMAARRAAWWLRESRRCKKAGMLYSLIGTCKLRQVTP
jgi:hypothetical protein